MPPISMFPWGPLPAIMAKVFSGLMDGDQSMEDDASPDKTTEPHDEHEGHGSHHDTDGDS